MSIKIVADSSCDLTDKMRKEMKISIAPLILYLNEKPYIDDENLDVRQYVKDMGVCPVSPKTACPSPEDYIKRYEDEDSVFVVTLSSQLSGSYNSAVLAKNIFLDTVGKKFIHVFDSLSASVAETLVAIK